MADIPPSTRWSNSPCADVVDKRHARAKPDPRPGERTVHGSDTGLERPAGLQAEDTGPSGDDAVTRRLPIDGTAHGCWADQKNRKMPSEG
jgi:hypothetical protein